MLSQLLAFLYNAKDERVKAEVFFWRYGVTFPEASPRLKTPCAAPVYKQNS